MRKLLVLLVFTMLLFGCSDKPKNPTATSTAVPQILNEVSPTPTPTPTSTPAALRIVKGPNTKLSNIILEISWVTDRKSNSIVKWGQNGTFSQFKRIDENVTSHQVNITLEYRQTVNVRIGSCNEGNCTESGDFNVTTVHKPCASSMSYIGNGDFCIDNFENVIENGTAISKAGKMPSYKVSYDASANACRTAGKRLCSASEFVSACNIAGVKNVSTGDTECNLYSGFQRETGFTTNCTTQEGVHDLIGNLWEWVSDKVTSKTPISEGFIDRDNVLSAGRDYQFPLYFNKNTDAHGRDYYTSVQPDPTKYVGLGITLGGFSKSGTAGGCYATRVGLPLSGDVITGFRCCS